jgi:hypothetical protein
MKNNWVLHETKMLLPGSLNCSHPNVCSRGNNSIDQYFTCKVKHWITENIAINRSTFGTDSQEALRL